MLAWGERTVLFAGQGLPTPRVLGKIGTQLRKRARSQDRAKQTAPPPPPCDLAAWLATLDPSLGAGATTYDVCKSRCPYAKDESSSVPPFFSGVVDFYGSADPVCIISTMVHASHIRTTAYNDCVFIACPRSNTVETMEGDDIVYFREEVYNNKVALGPGRDKGIAHEGSTFAMYNKFKGDDLCGNQMAWRTTRRFSTNAP